MGAFYASVCTVAVAAGILTAAAATRVERLPAREDIAPMVNRIAKSDRLRPATAGRSGSEPFRSRLRQIGSRRPSPVN